MHIAILSDIHDHLWNLQFAVQTLQDAGAEKLICCGDLCSPFVIDELVKFPGDVHIVFGNNDADLYRITSKAAKHPNCYLHGELLETVFDGNRFAVNHFDTIARPLAMSGNYDVVCCGHNHEIEITRVGESMLINPGPIMGAKFSSGRWENVDATFVLYDTRSDDAKVFTITRSTTKPGKH
jgi:uncharacterized protein